MRNAVVALALSVATGELTEIERLPVSSERGRWKSTHTGNSLAAYPTASTVRGALERNLPSKNGKALSFDSTPKSRRRDTIRNQQVVLIVGRPPLRRRENPRGAGGPGAPFP